MNTSKTLKALNTSNTLKTSNTDEQRSVQAQKMEAVGRLACGIAHDFNELLTTITGYSELLITNLSGTDPNIQDVYEIRRAAVSAARLTRQLLAFGSPQRAHAEVLDLNAIVTQTAEILRRTLGENIGVTLALDPGIPRIKADAGQLEQIVVNLAINARDAMPNGGHLTFTTSPYVADRDATGFAREYVRLTVADTGCGIPQETRSKVFDPFFTTKGAAGTGLGLAMVYGIVTQNGGRIDLDSTVGVGTTFSIDLPATSDASPIAALSASPPRFVDGYASVLIVEDDPGVRQIVEIVLRRAGHEVVAVEGPHEALAFLNGQSNINLVLIDVVMPDMNGYELAAEIKKIAPGARIVFMSGYAPDTGRQPVDDNFLAKPFTTESLTHVVRHAMARVS
jgi:two-component system cell cycle sensor histidine kinase/response regulator CckA